MEVRHFSLESALAQSQGNTRQLEAKISPTSDQVTPIFRS
jgi:hypothetical protein